MRKLWQKYVPVVVRRIYSVNIKIFLGYILSAEGHQMFPLMKRCHFASFLTSWRRLMTLLHLRYVTLFDHTIHLKYVTKKIWQCKSTFRLSGQTTIWLHGIPKGHFPVYAQISSSQSAWVSTFRLGQSHTSNSLYNVITNKSYVLSYWGLEGWSFFQYEVNEVSGVNLPTLKNSMKL